MTETFAKVGATLRQTISEQRVVNHNLRVLRDQKQRLKAELDIVQALIDRAVALKVDDEPADGPLQE